jgi:hypothetical protein
MLSKLSVFVLAATTGFKSALALPANVGITPTPMQVVADRSVDTGKWSLYCRHGVPQCGL